PDECPGKKERFVAINELSLEDVEDPDVATVLENVDKFIEDLNKEEEEEEEQDDNPADDPLLGVRLELPAYILLRAATDTELAAEDKAAEDKAAEEARKAEEVQALELAEKALIVKAAEEAGEEPVTA
ncbi:hypothetical protein LTR56_026868, partial [Elasticomyces elasticus]